MKVTTLTPESFAEACERLEKLCRDFNPDTVVGIASGGVYVAEQMFSELPHVRIACQRPSTHFKQSHERLFRMIRRLPRCFRDQLRIWEARRLAGRPAQPVLPVILDDTVRDTLQRSKRVLIIDDAIDSGTTMRAVCDAVDTVPGDRRRAIATLTVTTANPVIEPDFSLMPRGTLLRFPWSKDYKP